jgi:hypothetical protein
VDVYLHDRIHGVTLRVSASGDAAGGFGASISGDGMYTTFYGSYPLSPRDTNRFNDVFVFSPLAPVERAGPVLGVAARGSGPTAPCAASSEYTRVGSRGAHQDVTPSVFPHAVSVEAWAFEDETHYDERSVVRFKYRIDVSHSPAAPSARTADVRIQLSWDNDTDYDLYVYDTDGELLAVSYNTNLSPILRPLSDWATGAGEVVLLPRVPHCKDLRVEIVNNFGLPTPEMTLDTTLGSFE